MKNWRCSVCGYVHKGENPPDKCPNCNAPSDKFAEMDPSQEVIFMNYGMKLSYGTQVEVNPFFGDYESISPYIYNLPVGTKVPLHKHPTTDEFFFILKGKIKFIVGDKTFTVTKGDTIQGKMNIPHGFENIGDEPAAFLSLKGPKPVDLIFIENEKTAD